MAKDVLSLDIDFLLTPNELHLKTNPGDYSNTKLINWNNVKHIKINGVKYTTMFWDADIFWQEHRSELEKFNSCK